MEEQKIATQITNDYIYLVSKANIPGSQNVSGWHNVSKERRESFMASIPAIALLLENNGISLSNMSYDENLEDYYFVCLKALEKVGYVVLKTDHLELRYTTNYVFNDQVCSIDSSVVSKGNNISGCICELINEKEMVQTNFNEEGIILDNSGIKPYDSKLGRDRMQEVIVAEQIKFYYTQQQKENLKQL